MLAAIGRVATESAQTEERLRNLLCFLMDSEFGHAVSAGEDLSNLALQCQRVMRYNHSLTDGQIEDLGETLRAIGFLRTHRNFVVHARWERGERPGEHIGLRSSRASVRPGGRGLSEGVIWTVADAEWVADAFAAITRALDSFIASAFDRAFVPLIERAAWAKMNARIEQLLQREPRTVPDDEAVPPPLEAK
jgi:hypothetical protein